MANILKGERDDQELQTSSGTAEIGGNAGGLGVTQTPTPEAQPNADAGKIASLNKNVNFAPVLDFVKGQGTEARGAIDNEKTNFKTALGSFSPFGDADRSTLSDVLEGRQGLDVGQNLINTQYTGPAGVNRGVYDPVVNRYVQSAAQTQNQSGINQLLGSMRPDLTPGERNFDSSIYGKNPGYKTQARGLVDDSYQVQNLGNTTYNAGNDRIGERKSVIAGYDQAAKDYVTDRQSQINNALKQQMSDASAADAAYKSNANFGNMQNFSVNPNEFVAPAASYRDATQADVDAAQQNKIITPEDALDLAGLDDPFRNAQFKLAAPDRWNELFNTSANGRPLWAPIPVSGAAPYSFSQTLDPAAFGGFTTGDTPTRNNVATSDQISQFNNAASLLNSNDRLVDLDRRTTTTNFNDAGWQNALAAAMAEQQRIRALNQKWVEDHQVQRMENTPASSKSNYNDGSGANSEGSDTGGDPDSDTSGGDAGSSNDGPGYARGGLVGKKPTGGLASLASLRTGKISTDADRVAPIPTYKNGGYLPMNMGDHRKLDDVAIKADEGEMVLRRSSANALGPQNLKKLNEIDKAPPQKQKMMRDALHAALSRM